MTPPPVTVCGRVTFLTVSYVAVDKTFSGTLPQWLFLDQFRPVAQEEKGR
jgi:hypothetical protein